MSKKLTISIILITVIVALSVFMCLTLTYCVTPSGIGRGYYDLIDENGNFVEKNRRTWEIFQDTATYLYGDSGRLVYKIIEEEGKIFFEGNVWDSSNNKSTVRYEVQYYKKGKTLTIKMPINLDEPIDEVKICELRFKRNGIFIG